MRGNLRLCYEMKYIGIGLCGDEPVYLRDMPARHVFWNLNYCYGSWQENAAYINIWKIMDRFKRRLPANCKII